MARRDSRNVARFWRDQQLRGLSLMHADFRTHEYPPHRHDGYVIAVTEQGGSVIKSRGVVENADESALFVFNPDETHSGWMGASPHWRYRSLYIEQEAIDAIAHGLGLASTPYFMTNRFTDRDLIRGFIALHYALEGGCDALRERELLIASFAALFQRHGSGGCRPEPAPRDRGRLAAVRAQIHVGIGRDLQLEALSESVSMTQYQLIRLFRRTLGLTPHAYVIQARLDAARRYLATGMQIGGAAVAAGFYDQSALNRYFKRSYGITPAQYARAARPDR